MGCVSRTGLLFALCFVSLTAFAPEPGKAVKGPGILKHRRFETAEEEKNFKNFMEKYEQVLQELQNDPRFKTAKSRNDEAAKRLRDDIERKLQRAREEKEKEASSGESSSSDLDKNPLFQRQKRKLSGDDGGPSGSPGSSGGSTGPSPPKRFRSKA
ncbi:hypothetical protein ACSSS7_006002 [Eimeria intestinalis]